MKLLIVIFSIAALIAVSHGDCVPDPVNPSNGISGGHNDIEIDNNVKQIALNVTTLYNNRYSGSPNFFKITCLKKAQSQIVSGVLYTITATISETVCDKTQMPSPGLLTQSNVDSCALKEGGKSSNCVFKYWTEPWKSNYSLTEAECS